MHVIFIKSYKKKAILFSAILLLWVLVFIAGNFFIHNGLVFNVTVNNYLTFSYPFKFQVDNIYVNENVDTNFIETNSSFKKPLAQKFSNYNSLKGNFSFNYPSAFILNPIDFAGSDILYHIDFHDKSQASHGFVQVWSMPYSLNEFLDSSKSTSQERFKYFSSTAVTINGLPGYYWDYLIHGSDNMYHKCSEVFFKKDNNMYRISYFVPENSWNKSESTIFWNIVDSFKTY